MSVALWRNTVTGIWLAFMPAAAWTDAALEPMNTYPAIARPASPCRRRRATAPAALLAFCVSAFLLQSTTGVWAQGTPGPAAAKDDPIKLEAFVSTGTRFNDRTVIQSPVPIDIITGAEMQQGGYTETAQMLQSLVPSFNFPRPSLTDGTDHIRPATLRGLAPDQVLVLINGKRRHTSALINVNGAVGRGSGSRSAERRVGDGG